MNESLEGSEQLPTVHEITSQEATIEPLILEPYPGFTNSQLHDNITLVPPRYKEEPVLAVLRMAPEPKWHFYERPNHQASIKLPADDMGLERWNLDAFTASEDYWYEFGRYTFGKGRNESQLKSDPTIPIDTMFLYDRMQDEKIVVERGNQDVMFREGTISQNGEGVAYIRQRKKIGETQWDYFPDSEIVIRRIIDEGQGKKVEDVVEVPFILPKFGLNRNSYLSFSPDGAYLTFIDVLRNEEKNPENINGVNTPVMKIVNTADGSVNEVRLAHGIGSIEMPPVWSRQGDKMAVVVDLREKGHIDMGKMLIIVDITTGEVRKVEIEDATYLNTLDVLSDNTIAVFQQSNHISDSPDDRSLIHILDFEGNLVKKHYLHPRLPHNRKFVVSPLDEPDKNYLVFSNKHHFGDSDTRSWMSLFDLDSGEQKAVPVLFEGVIVDDQFGIDAYGNPLSKRTGGR